MEGGKRKKHNKKKPIIILKKVAPPKKQSIQTGKFKVIPTSDADKIAKAVASLIPRPKGKKQSTIESRMIKTKKESIKLPFEELVSRRLGKEELKAEREELKKPRKERADKGTHRKKWYEDRGLPVPASVEELKPIPRRTSTVSTEPESVKKEKSEKKEKKSEKSHPMKDKPAPPPPADTEIIVEPAPAPVHITIKKTPVKSPVKSTEPVREKAKEKPPKEPFKKPVTEKPSTITRMRIPKRKPFVRVPASPETDAAGSDSESSIASSGEGRGLIIVPPKKKTSARA